MTNIYGDEKKISNERRLFQIALEALEGEGFKVERIPKIGKSSIRRITKNGKSQTATIRTTQDQWFAFPLTEDGGWLTLDDSDVVVVSSMSDDKKSGWVHVLPADEVRDRFAKARAARTKAGYKSHVGRGMWVGLYQEEDGQTARFIGSGIGNVYPRIAEIPLDPSIVNKNQDSPIERQPNDEILTIAEAKRRLALSLGVPVEAIKISIEA